MPLYLTVSQGPSADRTRPILAVSDQGVIAALLREIGRLADPRTNAPPLPMEQERAAEEEVQVRASGPARLTIVGEEAR